ncbi:hypothetical protein FRC19_001075 [Serendipita sp. 401]|nr:hypothetical protein FRC19_001075 [Serendipita sp. 401]
MSTPEPVDEPVPVQNEGNTVPEPEPTKHIRPRDKGHLLAPQDVDHPRDRWDMYYVYMFIRKFTTLKEDIPSFIDVTDLENAILDDSGKVNILLEQVILRFILNLRPNTRNTSSDQIPATLSSILHEFLKDKDRPRERTVFWDYNSDSNVMPAKDQGGDLWSYSWDLKLKILRQLVDWQLEYSASIRDIIDTAWQFKPKAHKKKSETPKLAPEAGEPGSRESLLVKPLGQDQLRLRFWVADDSPRLYTSTNPWKTGCRFQCVAQNLDQYIDWIEKLRYIAPPEAEDGKPYRDARCEIHWDLIYAMELRVDTIERGLEEEKRLRDALAREAEQIAAGNIAGPSMIQTRSKASQVDEEDAVMREVVNLSEDEPPRDSRRSQSSDEMLRTRDTTPAGNAEFDYEDSPEQDGHNVASVSGALDEGISFKTDIDPSILKKRPKKRRRHTSPATGKPTRASARKKQLTDEMEGVQANGFETQESVEVVVDAAMGLTTTDSGMEMAPQSLSSTEVMHGLKGGRGKNTKFWYFDEVGAPSKRPAEMVDDPDAVLKRRRAKKLEGQSTATDNTGAIVVSRRPTSLGATVPDFLDKYVSFVPPQYET